MVKISLQYMFHVKKYSRMTLVIENVFIQPIVTKKIKFRIFDDIHLYIFSKKKILRPPARDLLSSPGAPETKLYFFISF